MQNKKYFVIGGTMLMAVLSVNVYASAFQAFETNASGLGNSFAGAAIADDASVEFDNPAAIVRFDRPQMAASAVVVAASGKFTIDKFQPSDLPGKTQVDPLDTNILPAIHFVSPIYQRLFIGMGITVPYGYDTDYGNDSVASYFATKSQIVAANFNPSLAVKVTDQFSIGAGVSAQCLDAELDRKGATVAGFKVQNIKNSVDDWGLGWNIGALYQLSQYSRIGLAYRSEIKHSPNGEMKFQLLPIPPLVPNIIDASLPSSTKIDLPETVILSGYHEFSPKIAAMATVTYTHWHRFDYLVVKTGGTIITFSENFNDSFRYALGANYRINDQWLLRFGTAYDQSPVNDANRTVPLPDGDRYWLSTGIQWMINSHYVVDAGYAHIFIKDGTVNKYDPLVPGRITGRYTNNSANLVGLQLAVKLDSL